MKTPPVHARLRLLATTDLHMQILTHDYFIDAPQGNSGLVALTDLIVSERDKSDAATLLFDVGDFLQGNPLADFLAANGAPDEVHPMIGAMNDLAYDAVTLGNHEFDYGLDFLFDTLKHLECPVVCANLADAAGDHLVQPSTMINLAIQCSDGKARTLRVGVLGLTTPQVVDWDHAALDDAITSFDIIETAQSEIKAMKKQGADIIVALAHSGIGPTERTERMENAVIPLAGCEGIDVVLSGHIHQKFPNKGGANVGPIDGTSGHIHGVPVVMAGSFGSHLGRIMLDLEWVDGNWCVAGSTVDVLAPTVGYSSKKAEKLVDGIRQRVKPAHDATLLALRKPITETTIPFGTHFATVMPCPPLALLADAQIAAVKDQLKMAGLDQLPLISAVAAYVAGGRKGPRHYIDINKGPVTLKDVAAIYPFANQTCAIKLTGLQVRQWLEHAANMFRVLENGLAQQQLAKHDAASYDFDTIYGLTYEFDLCAETNRIKSLQYQGRIVEDEQVFILATNSYRAYGGGGYVSSGGADIVATSDSTIPDALIAHLKHTKMIGDTPARHWSFTPSAGTCAQFESGPEAVLPPDGPRITRGAMQADGFQEFTIHL